MRSGVVIQAHDSDLFRHDTLLDPRSQSRQQIQVRRSGTATAMRHTGNHEEPSRALGRMLHFSPSLLHMLKIVDCALRSDQGIGPSVVEQQLSPICWKVVRSVSVAFSHGPSL